MRNCLVTLGLVLAPAILLAADVSGTWKVDGDVQGHPVNFSCALAQEDETLSGTATLSDGTEVPVTGTSKDTTVSFEFDTADGAYHLVFSGMLVIQPAARVGNRERHRRQPLGRRVNDDHGVALPWIAGCLVPDTTPQVDYLLAAHVDAAGATQFPASCEVLLEGIVHGFESASDMPFDNVWCHGCHGVPRSGPAVEASGTCSRRTRRLAMLSQCACSIRVLEEARSGPTYLPANRACIASRGVRAPGFSGNFRSGCGNVRMKAHRRIEDAPRLRTFRF
jgi:hypothetical protein